jgi:hypothetical protein
MIVTAVQPVGAQSYAAAQNGYAVPAMLVSNPLTSRSRVGRHGDRGFADWGYAYDPYFYPDSHAFEPSVMVIVVPTQQAQQAQPSPAPTPAPPKELAQAKVDEYHWPSSAGGSSGTYSIVTNDGQVQLAAWVWVQGDALCYSTPEHNAGRVLIDSIDPQATRQRNAGQQLPWLPSNTATELSLGVAVHQNTGRNSRG